MHASNESSNKLAVGIISSFTFSHVTKFLEEECKKLGANVDFYVGKYRQHIQEIIDPKSGLYLFDPNLIIIFFDARELLGDLYFFPYQLSDAERLQWTREKLREIHQLLKAVLSYSSAKIIFHNFEIPTYSPIGILENKQEFGLFESIEKINTDLRNAYKNDTRVFIFDYDAFCSKKGKENIFDPKMYYLGDIKIAIAHTQSLCHEYAAYLKPLLCLSKKCVVLDLDNTLWGGVVGEDGVAGIKLGNTPEGRPFLEFQKLLLSLYHRGIILAVNSKNNIEDVEKVFREHPDMVLRQDHFLVLKVNWQDKVANMREIAAELNIGIDSLVFIDDDDATRELIRQVLPSVHVIDLPKDPALYSQTLSQINDFNVLQLTEEDKTRNALMSAEKKREKSFTSIGDISGFIQSLRLKISILSSNEFTVPRVAQLTQKTNQFNLTTRRYQEEDIQFLSRSEDYMIKCFQVEDRFGGYGITGVCIVKKDQHIWLIDTFLLSCRILGKDVEFACMDYILRKAKLSGAESVIGEFIRTKKNKPAENFFQICGFNKISSSDVRETWSFPLSADFTHGTDYIEVIEKETQ